METSPKTPPRKFLSKNTLPPSPSTEIVSPVTKVLIGGPRTRASKKDIATTLLANARKRQQKSKLNSSTPSKTLPFTPYSSSSSVTSRVLRMKIRERTDGYSENEAPTPSSETTVDIKPSSERKARVPKSVSKRKSANVPFTQWRLNSLASNSDKDK